MNEDRPSRSDEDEPEARPDWRVDAAASLERLRPSPAEVEAPQADGGKLVFTDARRVNGACPRTWAGSAARRWRRPRPAMSYELGAVEPSYAQVAAIERLNELRASGAWSEEDYLREKRRIVGTEG